MLTPKRPLVEVAVDSVASAVAAEAAGADRLELCQCLELGGLTPSPGLLEAVRRRVRIPVFVMVRSVTGPFRYDGLETEVMASDVKRAGEAGAAGVVIGALTADGRIDREAVAALVAAAGTVPVTFHRAIDLVADVPGALEELVSLGVARVLTSGGPSTAFAGRSVLADMVRRSAGRLTILAGGGVRADHVAELVRTSGVSEVHLSGVVADEQTAVLSGYGRAFLPAVARVEAVLAALR